MGTGGHTLRREDRSIPDTQMSPTQGGSNVATAERIRVLVADDEETVRDVLEALLGLEPEIDLIDSGADTETAIELACKELPDVALVDVRMPGGGGPRATREIVRKSPPARVVALSADQDVTTVLTMLRAGRLAMS